MVPQEAVLHFIRVNVVSGDRSRRVHGPDEGAQVEGRASARCVQSCEGTVGFSQEAAMMQMELVKISRNSPRGVDG